MSPPRRQFDKSTVPPFEWSCNGGAVRPSGKSAILHGIGETVTQPS